MSNGPSPSSADEPSVPIPPPRVQSVLFSSAIGGFLGAAVGVIVVIWVMGCGC